MSEIDTVTREVIAALRSAIFVEGLASGLLNGAEEDCWYVDELRERWTRGFRRGRLLAVMAVENERLKKEKESLEEIIRQRHEK